jgi:methionyl-tRNA formyltransferase
MRKKALFIGLKDCEDSRRAFEFLNVCGFDTTPVWTDNKRGAKLPPHVKEWSGDYLFHFRSYCILRKGLLDRVSIASINFHPCPPRYPGSGGISLGLYNDDSYSGVTVHYMNEKVDNGEILKIYEVPILKDDTVSSLLSRVHYQQLAAFFDFAGRLAKGGEKYLKSQSVLSENKRWGKHVGKMKEIDELQKVNFNTSKEELERIIKSTSIGNHGPVLEMHGYKFHYRGKNK